MAHEFTTSFMKDSVAVFHNVKNLTERAMLQAPDEALFATLDPESNSAWPSPCATTMNTPKK